ncbi:MAG: phytanoyl-CoA dioxygenase family protein [Pseudomonadota bacterium]
MRTFAPGEVDKTAIIDELLSGAGAVRLTGLFTPEQIASARKVIMDHSNREAETVTHFQGAAEEEGKLALQRRVWNLLAKGDVFSDMATHPVVMDIMRSFLGSEFIMGSIAANRILPGGPGQEPHIDYPYWDFHKPETHPVGLNASFPMNAQVTIILDPFTEESGATAYLPGTQKLLRYPDASDHFYERCSRMLGEPGDTIIFFGATWHCAMPNRSDHDRNAVLIEYLPKWITPLEDMPAVLSKDFIAAASPELRQLLSFDFPFPTNLDEQEAGNAEGRK